MYKTRCDTLQAQVTQNADEIQRMKKSIIELKMEHSLAVQKIELETRKMSTNELETATLRYDKEIIALRRDAQLAQSSFNSKLAELEHLYCNY